MTLIFKYKIVKRPDGTEVKTPSIPVTLAGKEVIDTIALIDSGADISAISRDMAEILGLDISGKHFPAFGIGGKVDAVDTKISLTVQNAHEKYTFLMPIKVILGNYDFPVLLGRAGFFDKFVVIFDQAKLSVSIKKVSRQ